MGAGGLHDHGETTAHPRKKHRHAAREAIPGDPTECWFHMLQVIGGLTALTFLIARTKLSKFTPAQATAAIVVSYYWHFVDIVWVGLFATIFIVR